MIDQCSKADRETGQGNGDASPRAPEPCRLAVIFHRPYIYYCQFIKSLALRPELDVTAYFYTRLGLGSTHDPDLGLRLDPAHAALNGYRSKFLRNYSPVPAPHTNLGLFHPRVVVELLRGYDAVLVYGWCGISSWLAYLTAFARGLPVLLLSDRNALMPQAPGIRQARLRWLFRHASAFLVIGKRNAEFYAQNGVESQRMFLTPLAVDNDFYRAEAQRLEPQRPALRQQLGIGENGCVFLYVGRFVAYKGLTDLLRAFKELANPDSHLVLVGTGPEEAHLRDRAATQGLARVHFAGSKSYEELPAYYALADVFVLPSHVEPWAVVVNEAMNFALPIIASRQVGAAEDLVEEGVNGFRFEAGDAATLRELMRRLAESPDLRRKMGQAGLPIIREWSFGRASEGVLAALRSLRLSPGNRPVSHPAESSGAATPRSHAGEGGD